MLVGLLPGLCRRTPLVCIAAIRSASLRSPSRRAPFATYVGSRAVVARFMPCYGVIARSGFTCTAAVGLRRFVLCPVHRLLSMSGSFRSHAGGVQCSLSAMSVARVYTQHQLRSGTHQRCQIVGGVDPSPRPSSHRFSGEQRAVPFRDSGVQGLLRDGSVSGVETQLKQAYTRTPGTRTAEGKRRHRFPAPRGAHTARVRYSTECTVMRS